MVQTCVVACSSLAFAGGFGCYLLSMDSQSFRNAGTIPGNRPEVCALTLLKCFPSHLQPVQYHLMLPILLLIGLLQKYVTGCVPQKNSGWQYAAKSHRMQASCLALA